MTWDTHFNHNEERRQNAEPQHEEDVAEFICDCCGYFETPPINKKCPRCKFPIDLGDMGRHMIHF